MELSADFRKALGFENACVRFEHHITEPQKSIVIQPYNRRAELLEIADHVANIAAKHEGGDPEVDVTPQPPLRHPRLLPREKGSHRKRRLGKPGAQFSRQSGCLQPHRLGFDRERPELRGGEEPAHLTGRNASLPCSLSDGEGRSSHDPCQDEFLPPRAPPRKRVAQASGS